MRENSAGYVFRMVMGETAALVVVATLAGLGSTWALARYVRSMLYGLDELDPAILTFAAFLLAAIVLIASVGPTLRAVRVDPMTSLRNE